MVWAEKYVGFYLSYTLPTVMLCFCPAIMWWGRKRYERRPPGGSVLGPAFKLWILAQKGRWSVNPFTTYKNLHDGTMWDNVKPSKFSDETRPSWMNFDDAWVDEVRRGFSACAVFLYYPLFWLCYNQGKLLSDTRPSLNSQVLTAIPSEQQPGISSRDYAASRRAQRCHHQPEPLFSARLHSPLRHLHLPLLP